MDDNLLSASAAARAFRVPAKWLKNEADAGRLPVLKAGARYLFSRRVLEVELLRRAEEGGRP